MIPTISFGEDCDLVVSVPSPTGTYSQSNTNERIAQEIILTKTNMAACSGRIGFSNGAASSIPRALSFLNSTLSYSIYENNYSLVNLKDIPDSSSTEEYITFSFVAGENITQSIPFYYKLDDNQQQFFLKRSGTYTDTVNINFYPLEGLIPYKTTSMNITGIVTPLYSIRVGASNSNYEFSTIDHQLTFDKFNQSRTASAYVLANDSYTLSVTSLNNGKLIHSVDTNSNISYALSIDGIPITLETVDSIQYENITPSIGFDHVLNFSCIINSQNQLSGTYSDVLTITVSPTL